MTDIVVPVLGESVTEATVARWLRRPGDVVAKDNPLIVLDTEKVEVEIAAPEAGVLQEILAAEGAKVGIGSLLGRIASTLSGAASAPQPVVQQQAPQQAPQPAPQAAPAAAAAGARTAIPVATLGGESVASGSVGAWRKKPGDAVKSGEILVEIDTEKVAIDITSPVDGVLEEAAPTGTKIAVGAVIGFVRSGAVAPGAAAQPAPAAAPAPAAPQPASNPGGGPILMPAAQRVVAENNLNPAAIAGSGLGGRVTKSDALAALQSGPGRAGPPVVHVPRQLRAKEERVEMSSVRQTIARRLKEAQNSAAILTTFNEVDMSAVMAARARYKEEFERKHGVKLGFMSFFVKACVNALQEIPEVNAEIDGPHIIYKNYYDIGIAVGTDKGLVVPVLRGADEMNMGEIERGIGLLGQKARDRKLTLDDLQGASFTISNGGVYGSLMSTPILNAPQSGILGMHKIQDRPMVVNGQIVIRPMMYLALSYDHRIVDGKQAVTFLVRVKEGLEDPERMFMSL